MTTSEGSSQSAFWQGASTGVAAATVLVCAITGSFLGTGLPTLVEAFLGALVGAVCFCLFLIVARRLVRYVPIIPSRFYAFLIAALAAFIVLRATRFRWDPGLFYPAAIVFLAAQATLAGSIWAWIENEGNKKFLGALALAALIVNVTGFAWLAHGGSDPYPVEMKDSSAPPAGVTVPNPAEPGPFDVEALTYGSGTDIRRPEFGEGVDLKTETVDASKLLPEWKGFKALARTWYWGFSLDEAPLNGRVWLPVGGGPFPLALVVHGNHRMEDHSDPGYAYLGELLASRGFITVSVDENYVNATWSGDFGGKEMALRAWLLLEHLRVWREWNQTPGHRFHEKVDLDEIALVGHSRGGEAAAIAAAFNELPFYPDDATVAFDYGFSIRSVVAIAQIDRRYPRRIELENVNFLALQGSYDADEPSFHGVRQFRRIRFTDGHYWFKAGIYIHRANHGQFNTGWGRRDSGPPSAWLLNLNPIISGEDQRQIAKGYISGFLEASLRDDHRFLPLFRDPRHGSKWLPDDIVYVHQFDDASFRPVADFEEDLDVTTASHPGATIKAEGLSLWREEELMFRDESTQRTNVAVVGWNGDDGSYTLQLGERPPELDDSTVLSFFLASSQERLDDEEESPEDWPPLEIAVELEDRSGASGSVPLAEIAPVIPPLEVQYLKLERLNRKSYKSTWEPILQSYEVPLSRFGELNVAELATIRFRARSGRGVVILDDVGFRSAKADIEPGER